MAAQDNSFSFSTILRAVSASMRSPVIFVLLIFLLASAALVGWTVAEYFVERRHMRISLPALLERLRTSRNLKATIRRSGLLQRQKDALCELASHPDFTPELREALAVRLLDGEQERYDRIVRLSDLIVRLAPMFGLLGTLIPLGPGIIALGNGDTFTLSESMLTAFDTTVAGLLAAAAATVVTTLRKAWYREYMSILEVLCQCILESEQQRKSSEQPAEQQPRRQSPQRDSLRSGQNNSVSPQRNYGRQDAHTGENPSSAAGWGQDSVSAKGRSTETPLAKEYAEEFTEGFAEDWRNASSPAAQGTDAPTPRDWSQIPLSDMEVYNWNAAANIQERIPVYDKPSPEKIREFAGLGKYAAEQSGGTVNNPAAGTEDMEGGYGLASSESQTDPSQ